MSEKHTEEVKTVVTEDCKEKFIALAVIHGLKPSEYLRLLLEKEIYGALHVTSLSVHAEVSRSNARLNQAYGVK